MTQSNASPDAAVDVADVKFARLADYLGLWSIEPTRGLSLFDRCVRTDLVAHIAEAGRKANVQERNMRNQLSVGARVQQATDGEQAYKLAVIEASGTLMKHASSLDESTSTVVLRKQIRDAANDPGIAAILLVIDSPGGSVAGTADLAAAVKYANAKKPLYAFAEDLAASAAYWVGSQAEKFYANDNTALIGSIGTFIGTYDYSEAAAKEGIKAKVYATGPLKGTGFPGATITAEQDAYLQGIVDETQEMFLDAVVAGRGLSRAEVKKLATGGVYVAGNAQKSGLIDGVKSIDAVMQELVGAVKRRKTATARQSQEIVMSTNADKPSEAQAEQKPAESKPAETKPASAETKPTESAATGKPAETPAEKPAQTEGQKFLAAFGDQGGKWYAEGKTFEEARALHSAALQSQLDAANEKLKAQDDVIKSIRGETAPVSSEPDAKEQGDKTSAAAKRYAGVLSPGLAAFAASLHIPTGDAAKK